MLHKINANFPTVTFTYIKLTRNFQIQCAPNFILCEFAVIQTSQHTYIQRKKHKCKWTFQEERLKNLGIPSEKQINTKTSRKSF